MIKWTLFKGPMVYSAFCALVVLALLGKQLMDRPIYIAPFAAEPGTIPTELSTYIVDQTKQKISQIYNYSKDMFEMRKLGERDLALDVTIGKTGWSFQSLANAFISMTSADLTGSISQDRQGLVLAWNTTIAKDHSTSGGRLIIPIAQAGATLRSPDTTAAVAVESLFGDVEPAILCLALNAVAQISPEVAANYLHKMDQSAGAMGADGSAGMRRCDLDDDVDLFSRVSEDESEPPATRVYARVGISVHYSDARDFEEEMIHALRATELAAQTMPCDDNRSLLTAWQGIKCTMLFQRREKNRRAQIAAWMQLGAAFSDAASNSRTLRALHESRRAAIAAYDHVIAIDHNNAAAFDAKGLQLSLIGRPWEAQLAYEKSLDAGETAAGQMDLGLWSIHGRNDRYSERNLTVRELVDAEKHFLSAIGLHTEYWDAHGLLGYVLYENQKFDQAIGALQPAIAHDASNGGLRHLLGSSYARLCNFDAARAYFSNAYEMAAKAGTGDQNDERVLATLSDWGRTLNEFGFHRAALEQESAVLAKDTQRIDARLSLGEMRLAMGEIAEGRADLEAAVASDTAKTDAVLRAYLGALRRADQPGDAAAAYEQWRQEEWVPEVAPAATLDASIWPSKNDTRQEYAMALLESGQWKKAFSEFAVLALMGFVPGAQVSAELLAHTTEGQPDPNFLELIRGLATGADPIPPQTASRHVCHIANVPELVPLSEVALPLIDPTTAPGGAQTLTRATASMPAKAGGFVFEDRLSRD